jgi:predicted nucleic acid-binding protein
MARYLADKSALARIHHHDVAARLEAMFIGGQVATTAIVDLEVLFSARTGDDHQAIRAERALFPRVPMTERSCDRAIEVQGQLARTGRHRAAALPDLLIAAAAEQAGLTVLHYDADFELIGEITGQPTEWIVPRGSVP